MFRHFLFPVLCFAMLRQAIRKASLVHPGFRNFPVPCWSSSASYRAFSSSHKLLVSSSSTAGVLLLAASGIFGGGVFAALEGTRDEEKESGDNNEQDDQDDDDHDDDLDEYEEFPGYFPKGLTILDKHSAEVLLKNPQQDVIVAVIGRGCTVCKLFKIVYEQVSTFLKRSEPLPRLLYQRQPSNIGSCCSGRRPNHCRSYRWT